MNLILYNGSIYTMCEKNDKVEAVYIKENKIFKTGTTSDILKLKSHDTELIDLNGRCVVPGFNDSHLHMLGFASNLNLIDLSQAKSINDVIKISKDFISSNDIKPSEWVCGRGWNEEYFQDDQRALNKYDLDKISTENPILLTRVCGHIACLNSSAIEKLKITSNTIIDGGKIDQNENREVLGIIRENALCLLGDIGKLTTKNQIKDLLKKGFAYANSKGLTSIHSDDISHQGYGDFEDLFNVYKELEEENQLTLRVYEQCLLNNKETLERFIEKGYYTGKGNNFFKIGPLKILLDGSLGAKTASLTYDYADDPGNRGIICYTEKELDEMVSLAHKNNLTLAIHGIGDNAMYSIFNSIEKAQDEFYRDDPRHGIIHCQITDEKLTNLFKERNILAMVQPIFLHYDLHIIESRIGKERAKLTYNYKTMMDLGIHISFGTDCPVEDLNPLECIYCATTRKDLSGYPENGFNPKEKISVYDAVHAYTVGSAYASFEENIKGMIKSGMLADMIVLNEDIFEIHEEKIKDVVVDLTIVDGKIVYKR